MALEILPDLAGLGDRRRDPGAGGQVPVVAKRLPGTVQDALSGRAIRLAGQAQQDQAAATGRMFVMAAHA